MILSTTYINKVSAGLSVFFILLSLHSCESFTEIDPPRDAIVKEAVFSNETSANAAILGIYLQLTTAGFGQGHTTIYLGQSSDEMYKYFDDSSSMQLHKNDIVANNTNILGLWSGIYQVIGQANGSVEGLTGNMNVPENKRKQFLAEAKFLRAYCYFYLTNLWGDVPLITTTKWGSSSTSKRTSRNEVVQFIINDLLEAVDNLPLETSNNIRAKKWAATALLARVYLYEKKWSEAERYAQLTIDNTIGASNPLPNVSEVFFPESTETIFQIKPQSFYSSSMESTFMNLFGATYLLENAFVEDFENGDLRKASWVGHDADYFYAAKYTSSPYDSSAPAQYNVVLRAAEQFLIAAEARAQQNNISGAVEYLNVIRQRAGLEDLESEGLSQIESLRLVEKERKSEFFAEWGHRWLDLKRTSRALEVLGIIAGKNLNEEDLLYPIPISEIKLNPNLTQNKGY